MDGVKRENLDMLDKFIADHAIDQIFEKYRDNWHERDMF
jgi:propanediol dehydratase large subunit